MDQQTVQCGVGGGGVRGDPALGGGWGGRGREWAGEGHREVRGVAITNRGGGVNYRRLSKGARGKRGARLL